MEAWQLQMAEKRQRDKELGKQMAENRLIFENILADLSSSSADTTSFADSTTFVEEKVEDCRQKIA